MHSLPGRAGSEVSRPCGPVARGLGDGPVAVSRASGVRRVARGGLPRTRPAHADAALTAARAAGRSDAQMLTSPLLLVTVDADGRPLRRRIPSSSYRRRPGAT
jgi:hypothetical protein